MVDTGFPTVDALISGLLLDDTQFGVVNIKYTFELSAENADDSAYSVLNRDSIDRHLAVFAHMSDLTGVTFTEVSADDETADFYFAFKEDTPTAFVEDHLGGTLHVYNPARADPILGSYTDHLILHELGHGFGLEHGHGFGRLPDAFQGHSWSLMSYRAHPGTDSLFYADSHGPETYMAADIAALQYLYGANFNAASGDTVYTVDFDTGELLIDGVGQGVPLNREMLRTIWDGNGIDTLDLSNAQADLSIDLNPGQFTSFGDAFLAYQGEGPFGNDLHAEGNIGNPYLYEGNTASLLENAIGGDFADNIIGNVMDNVLDGGAGDDSLFGLIGDDRLVGGDGDDWIVDGIGQTIAKGDDGSDYVVALSGESELSGGSDDDIIIGGIDDDDLVGGRGNDILRGEAGQGLLFGSDTLDGGSDDDLLMGGRGADTFVFTVGDGNDTIASFDAFDAHELFIGGVDEVDLRGADFKSGVDKIALNGFTEIDADNVLSFVTDDVDTGHAVFNAEGTTITFFELTFADLQAEDFLFT